MIYAAAALAALAVILLGLLLNEHKKFVAAQTVHARKLGQAEQDAASSRTQTAEIEEALGEARAVRDARDSDLSAVRAELDASQTTNAGLQAAADELSESEQRSAERIAILEIDAERLRNGLAPIEPQTLWELELQRSERTWRHMVAVSPDFDESPFPEATDLLQLAVEVEAAALKEEAGAFLTVDWQAAPVEDPARSHLILRLAQEMLAEAAREPIPACLTVEGTGAVTLSMDPAEDEDVDLGLELRAPEVSGQLIEFDEDHQGRITVNYVHVSKTASSVEGSI